MLALIFRGVFLVGVLSWYSTSVWKMIDGYFKDRFQNYLQDEFRKYPKMRDDLNAYAVANAHKKGIAVTSETTLPAPDVKRQVEESLESGTSSVDVLTTVAPFLESADLAKETATGENRVKASVDKNVFQESLEMSSVRKEKPKPTGSQGFEKQSAVQMKKEKEKIDIKKKKKEVSHDQREDIKKKRRLIIESRSTTERSKKRKVKTITLTEADFMSAKITKDDDFLEFDLDDEILEKPREGILISELPFKPQIDIGDLESVTTDEFCPLTLEDEATCGIPSKWP